MATGKEILDLPMMGNDADADTIREYLIALLTKLWAEEEGFSGKRPFGSSGWSIELYQALVIGGIIPGELDPDGFVSDYDKVEGDQAIFKAIEALGGAEEDSDEDSGDED